MRLDGGGLETTFTSAFVDFYHLCLINDAHGKIGACFHVFIEILIDWSWRPLIDLYMSAILMVFVDFVAGNRGSDPDAFGGKYEGR